MKPRAALSFLFAALLPLLPLCALAQSAPATVEDVAVEIGANAVRYPQLKGLAEEAVQKAVNDDIVVKADIASHIVTLSTFSTVGESPWGLQVSYESYLNEALFSVVVSAKGKLPNGREGQTNTALSYDLKTGKRLALDSLFANVDEAVAAMEEMAEETLGTELSDYLEHSQLSPLPVDSFFLNADGITFYYPSKQLSYLSGYAGSCQFLYEEIAAFLKPDGLAALLRPEAPAPAEQARLIQTAVEAGKLPKLPVTLGQPMTEIVDAYRLVRTPDAFPGGRYFVLEAPQFRSVSLISDSMESGYEHSVLTGVQQRRGGLFGLAVGASQRSEWLALLGEPEETILFTQGMAYDYSLPVGQSDLYRYGGNELRLHSDDNGVLQAIQLND